MKNQSSVAPVDIAVDEGIPAPDEAHILVQAEMLVDKEDAHKQQSAPSHLDSATVHHSYLAAGMKPTSV